ncbi:hypothetical protein M3A01_25375 [Klebsiella pneumoniae]|uniref:hypothetical protein n=1 Tax=Klebsiella pneumoniae TaxID=573 RepID=UPI0020108ECF|nr:hypothetical protein [Klebsiella pneumoniae]MCL0526199.1 hypothetical protein [Klebsiella pneumoniae]
MMNLIKRLLRRIFRSLISSYGPAVLTILFVVAQGLFFPEPPLWLVPRVVVFLFLIFFRFVKF